MEVAEVITAKSAGMLEGMKRTNRDIHKVVEDLDKTQKELTHLKANFDFRVLCLAKEQEKETREYTKILIDSSVETMARLFRQLKDWVTQQLATCPTQPMATLQGLLTSTGQPTAFSRDPGMGDLLSLAPSKGSAVPAGVPTRVIGVPRATTQTPTFDNGQVRFFRCVEGGGAHEGIIRPAGYPHVETLV